MDLHSIDTVNVSKWNRRILNNYWFILIASTIVSFVNLFFTTLPKAEYSIYFILFPTLFLMGLLLIGEGLKRVVSTQVYANILIFIAGGIAFILIHFHSNVRGIETLLILPILASCIYFRKNKAILASGISIAIYLCLAFFNPFFKIRVSFSDMSSVIAILLFGGLFAINVMNRGIELLHNLQKSIKSSQDLMISRVIIEKMAKTDALTEINNHRAFQEYIDDLLKHSHVDSFHLAIIDIDNFKVVNDTYGHPIGDIILKYTAKVIQKNASENDFVARYGGEEFVILLTDTTKEECIKRCERIRKQINFTSHPEIEYGKITVSIGFHSYSSGMTKDEWFSGADQALYQAKQTGKNKLVVFQEEYQIESEGM